MQPSQRTPQRKPLPSINTMADYAKRPWYDKNKLYRIIFLTDTKEGFVFDLCVMTLVLISVSTVFLDTILAIHQQYHKYLYFLEWTCTVLLSIEYAFRVYASRNRWKYITSFYGVVDLLSFLPTYFSGIIFGIHYMLVLRILRIMRIFKIFRMGDYIRQGRQFAGAMRKSSAKIGIFMLFMVMLVSILGSIMYIIESPVNPNYSSIPRAIYWAIITLTTVGYGDITPVTSLGQFVSTVVMLLGYSIIAVPTGIISAEVTRSEIAASPKNTPHKKGVPHSTIYCHKCGHPTTTEANYCSQCGTALHKEVPSC